MFNLDYLHTKGEMLKDCFILWVTHDPQYKFGSYYLIDFKSNLVSFVIERPNEIVSFPINNTTFRSK